MSGVEVDVKISGFDEIKSQLEELKREAESVQAAIRGDRDERALWWWVFDKMLKEIGQRKDHIEDAASYANRALKLYRQSFPSAQ